MMNASAPSLTGANQAFESSGETILRGGRVQPSVATADNVDTSANAEKIMRFMRNCAPWLFDVYGNAKAYRHRLLEGSGHGRTIRVETDQVALQVGGTVSKPVE